MQEPTLSNLQSPVMRYFLATRPGFLTATIIAILIGLAAASTVGRVLWVPGILTLIGGLAAHAGINVLNDYYDDDAGSDQVNNDRIFPFTGGSRMIQNGVIDARSMSVYGWLLFAISGLIGILLTIWSGPGILIIGTCGLAIGWAYSAPPLRLCARGFGEISVALGFGVLIPLGTAYVQLGQFNPIACWAGLSFAFLITLVLYVNQFPDYRADVATGKLNWVARLTPRNAKLGYPLLVSMAYSTLVIGVSVGPLPTYTLLGLAALPFHLNGFYNLWYSAARVEKLKPAIQATLNGAMLQGILVATGLILDHIF